MLCWDAPSLQLAVQADGYVNTNDLRSLSAFRTFTDDFNREIVRRDGKKRFSVMEDEDGLLKVRANHGHGISGVEVVERELKFEDAITYLMRLGA